MGDTKAAAAKRLCLSGVALALAAVFALPLGVVAYARVRGRGDWPATEPPRPTATAAPFEVSTASWVLLRRVTELAPRTGERPHRLLERGRSTSRYGIAQPTDAVLRAYAEPLRALDEAISAPVARLRHDIPVADQGALLDTFDAALLRAEQARPAESAAALARYERFASRFAFGGDSMLAAMEGEALELRVLREVKRLDRAGLTAGELAPLAAALDEAASLPSPLASAYVGECAALESALRSSDAAGAWELVELGSYEPSSGGIRGLIARVSFDQRRTVAAHRARCIAHVTELAAPQARSPRRVGAQRSYLSFEASAWWQRLDNYSGSMLLDASESQLARFVAREDSLVMAREFTRVGVALLRHVSDRRTLPATLAELAPAYLPAAPPARVFGHALSWDSTQGHLSLDAPDPNVPRGDFSEGPAPFSWRIPY